MLTLPSCKHIFTVAGEEVASIEIKDTAITMPEVLPTSQAMETDEIQVLVEPSTPG